MSDRIFSRGDAALKLGRSIWVVFCWFAAAIMATGFTGIVVLLIYHLSIYGMILTVLGNVAFRHWIKGRSDEQEERTRREAEERRHPEEFALEDEG